MPWRDSSDLTVEQYDADGNVTTLVLDTDYTLDSNGILTTTAVPVTETLRVRINRAALQDQSFRKNGRLDTDALENAMDKLALEVQSVDRRARRSLRLRDSDEGEENGQYFPEAADRVSRYGYWDSAGDYDPRTGAQVAADLLPELNLTTSSAGRPTATAANDAARAALAPEFTGQLMVQLDTGRVYRGTGLTAGDWEEVSSLYATFADAAARAAAVPNFVGQLGKQTRGGSWYVAHGTSAGNWTWLAFGDYTPGTPTMWRAGLGYQTGDLVQVRGHIAQSGTLQAGSTSTVIKLASGGVTANDQWNTASIKFTSGTYSGISRKILDSAASGDTVTIEALAGAPGTDSYQILWESGRVIYECLADHTADATAFATDLNDSTAKWTPFAVEDYHYHTRGDANRGSYKEVWLMDGDRADDWSEIHNVALQELESRSSPGADSIWGPGYARRGTVNLTNGRYYFSQEIKLPPRSVLRGPNTPTSHGEGGVIITARKPDRVSHGGSEYYCIRSHEADDGDGGTGLDNEPGVGADTATYWTAIAAWNNSTSYVQGRVVTRSGSYYYCVRDHNSATAETEPPSDGSLELNNGGTTAGDNWFWYWQRISQAAPSAWVDGTFYFPANNTERDEYFIRSWDNDDTNPLLAHAGFESGLMNLRIDCNNVVNTGVYWWGSHGSRLEHVTVDNYSRAMARVAPSSDSYTIRGLKAPHTQSGNPSQYGIYFEDGVLSLQVENCNLNRCEVGLSFGTTRGLLVHGLECENVGLPFEFRENTHANFFGSGSSGNSGQPGAARFVGCNFARNPDDQYVVSKVYCGFVRMANQMFSLEIDGFVEDAANVSADEHADPYDRIRFQINTGDYYDWPIVPHLGFNLKSDAYTQLSFTFSAQEVRSNPHLWRSATGTLSDGNTEMRPTRAGSTAWNNSTNYSKGDFRIHGTAADDGGTMKYLAKQASGPATTVVEPGVTAGWEAYWQEIPGRIVVQGNPGVLTADVAETNIKLEPGIYKVYLGANNDYGGGTLTIRSRPTGVTGTMPVVFMTDDASRTVSAAGFATDSTEASGYIFHPGGNISYQLSGSTSPEVEFFVQPWVRGLGGDTNLAFPFS